MGTLIPVSFYPLSLFTSVAILYFITDIMFLHVKTQQTAQDFLMLIILTAILKKQKEIAIDTTLNPWFSWGFYNPIINGCFNTSLILYKH